MRPSTTFESSYWSPMVFDESRCSIYLVGIGLRGVGGFGDSFMARGTRNLAMRLCVLNAWSAYQTVKLELTVVAVLSDGVGTCFFAECDETLLMGYFKNCKWDGWGADAETERRMDVFSSIFNLCTPIGSRPSYDTIFGNTWLIYRVLVESGDSHGIW